MPRATYATADEKKKAKAAAARLCRERKKLAKRKNAHDELSPPPPPPPPVQLHELVSSNNDRLKCSSVDDAKKAKKAELDAERLRQERQRLERKRLGRKTASEHHAHDKLSSPPREVLNMQSNTLVSLLDSNASRLEAARLRRGRLKRELETASARHQDLLSKELQLQQVLKIQKDSRESSHLCRKYSCLLQDAVEKELASMGVPPQKNPEVDDEASSPVAARARSSKKKQKTKHVASPVKVFKKRKYVRRHVRDNIKGAPKFQACLDVLTSEEFGTADGDDDDDAEKIDWTKKTPTEILSAIAANKVLVSDLAPFEKNQNVINARKNCLDKWAVGSNWFHCGVCKERSPHTVDSGESCRDKNGKQVSVCKRCASNKEKENVYVWGAENNMDPFPNGYNEKLPKLTNEEKMMIAPILPIIRLIHIGGGRFSSKGYAINIEKENFDPWVESLPRHLENAPIYIVVSRKDKAEKVYKCRVRKDAILEWIHECIRNDQYWFRKIKIDHEYLEDLANTPAGDRIRRVIVQETEDSSDDDDFLDGEEVNGPDESGATGDGIDDDDDGGDEDDNDNSPPSYHIAQRIAEPSSDEVVKGTLADPLELPATGNAVNEWEVEGIQSGCFPYLFPHGTGDCTFTDRKVAVTRNHANKHLLWYCVKLEDGSFYYPFADDERWMAYAQTTDEKERLRQQKRVWFKNNPRFGHLSMEDLLQRAKDEPTFIFELMSSMIAYNGNILGSDAFFLQHRNDLETLIEQEGAPTMWYTLTAADNHWCDLFKCSGQTYDPSWTEKEKADARRKFVRRNPHIVDEFFYQRAGIMLQEFLESKGVLDADWVWYRVEYQKRGTAHIHGCCRLHSDPGLCALGDKVYDGRLAQRQLEESFDMTPKDGGFTADQTSLDEYKTSYPKLSEDARHQVLEKNPGLIDQLEARVADGIAAQTVITNYTDWLITTTHPNPPSDAESDERDDKTVFKTGPDNPHPSSIDPRPYFDGRKSEDEGTELYCQQCNCVQRHKHSAGYCCRGGKPCRGNYPHPLRETSIISVTESQNSKTGAITRRLDYYSSCNDRWLNPHIRAWMEVWQANMDVRITFDASKIVDYMCKYITKPEGGSNPRTKRLLGALIIKSADEDKSVEATLARVMQQTHGSRERSSQEHCHLINGQHLVHSTHTFRNINLRDELAMVDEITDANGKAQLSKRVSMVAAYAKRMLEDSYLHKDHFREALALNVAAMSLNEFCLNFVVGARANHRNKIKYREPAERKQVMRYLPKTRAIPSGDRKKYADFCKYQCIRYIVWVDRSCNAYGGEDATDDDIIARWESHLASLAASGFNAPETIMSEINRLMSSSRRKDSDIVCGDNGDGISDDDDETDNLDPMGFNAEHLQLQLDIDEDDIRIEFNEQHAISTMADYPDAVADPVSTFETLQDSTVSAPAVNSLPFEALNTKQKIFVRLLEAILEEWDKPKDQRKFSRGVILCGKGGTGKSTAVNYVRQTMLRQGESVALAPTGKAACVINGSTFFNRNNGLAVPVRDSGSKNKQYTPLNGFQLKRLQAKYENVKLVFIDEYSMISQESLSFINRRLQEIKANTEDFGGCILILAGDSAQLPPVCDPHPLWDTMAKNIKDTVREGRTLYHKFFTNVVRLDEVKRIAGDPNAEAFLKFLLRLAEGELTEGDWDDFMNRCSKSRMRDDEWERRGFEDKQRAYFLTPTNKAANEYNAKTLQSLGQSIVRIDAINSGPTKAIAAKMKALPSDECRGLRNEIFLCTGAKVSLTTNLWTEAGLANGQTGIVRDVVYADDAQVPDMPLFVWVEIEDYRGPSFFPGNQDRSKWVPIPPIVHVVPMRDTSSKKKDKCVEWKSAERRQIPLTLAWAWTIHKSQGQTLKGPIVMDIGAKEMEVGLTYVAVSRACAFNTIGLIKPATRNRLTSHIKYNVKLQHRGDADQRLVGLEVETFDRLKATGGARDLPDDLPPQHPLVPKYQKVDVKAHQQESKRQYMQNRRASKFDRKMQPTATPATSRKRQRVDPPAVVTPSPTPPPPTMTSNGRVPVTTTTSRKRRRNVPMTMERPETVAECCRMMRQDNFHPSFIEKATTLFDFYNVAGDGNCGVYCFEKYLSEALGEEVKGPTARRQQLQSMLVNEEILAEIEQYIDTTSTESGVSLSAYKNYCTENDIYVEGESYERGAPGARYVDLRTMGPLLISQFDISTFIHISGQQARSCSIWQRDEDSLLLNMRAVDLQAADARHSDFLLASLASLDPNDARYDAEKASTTFVVYLHGPHFWWLRPKAWRQPRT